MGKVKVTEKQAETIERIREDLTDDQIIEQHCTLQKNGALWAVYNNALNDMTMNRLARALHKGHEVEPTYYLNEFVTYKPNGKIYEIYKIPRIGVVNLKRKKSQINNVPIGEIRHATPGEVFWAESDRDVWELREDDILEYLGDLFIVDCFDSEAIWFRRTKVSHSDYSELVGYVREHFSVACFVEDRKDIKGDE